MKKGWFIFVVSILVATVLNTQKAAAFDKTQKDIEAVKNVIEAYKKSINLADTTLAATFWLTTSEASFIHPKGHEKGWEEIKSGIYGMFGSRFSKRDLKSYNEPFSYMVTWQLLNFTGFMMLSLMERIRNQCKVKVAKHRY